MHKFKLSFPNNIKLNIYFQVRKLDFHIAK